MYFPWKEIFHRKYLSGQATPLATLFQGDRTTGTPPGRKALSKIHKFYVQSTGTNKVYPHVHALFHLVQGSKLLGVHVHALFHLVQGSKLLGVGVPLLSNRLVTSSILATCDLVVLQALPIAKFSRTFQPPLPVLDLGRRIWAGLHICL